MLDKLFLLLQDCYLNGRKMYFALSGQQFITYALEHHCICLVNAKQSHTEVMTLFYSKKQKLVTSKHGLNDKSFSLDTVHESSGYILTLKVEIYLHVFVNCANIFIKGVILYFISQLQRHMFEHLIHLQVCITQNYSLNNGDAQ